MYPQWDVNEFPAHSSNRHDQLNCAIECEQKHLRLSLLFDLTMWFWRCHRTETNDTWISQFALRVTASTYTLHMAFCVVVPKSHLKIIWNSIETVFYNFYECLCFTHQRFYSQQFDFDFIQIFFVNAISVRAICKPNEQQKECNGKEEEINVSESCYHSICSSIDISSLRIYMYFCSRDGEFLKPENLQRTFLYVAGAHR